MAVQKLDPQKKAEMTRALVEAGYDDVLMVDRDTAKSVLTDKRQELLDHVAEGDVRSVRGLADDLGRDKGAVSRDLDRLFEYDLVEYEQEGARKIPTVKHDTVVAPLL